MEPGILVSDISHSDQEPVLTTMLPSEHNLSIVSVCDQEMSLSETTRSTVLRPLLRIIRLSDISQEVVSRQGGIISLSDTIPRLHHEPHRTSSISGTGSMEMGEKYRSDRQMSDQEYMHSMSNEAISIVPHDCVSTTRVSRIGPIYSMPSVAQGMQSQNGMQQAQDSSLLVLSKMGLISSSRQDHSSR